MRECQKSETVKNTKEKTDTTRKLSSSKSIKILPKVDGFRYMKQWISKSTKHDWLNSIVKTRFTELIEKIIASKGKLKLKQILT